MLTAIIVAAGSSSRMGGRIPKPYLPLAGMAVIRHSVLCFLAHPRIDRIVVVIHKDHRRFYDLALGDLKLEAPIIGGDQRGVSVLHALEAIEKKGHVLIHDAARPFIEHSIIDRVIDSLQEHQAVIPTIAVADTIKKVENHSVAATLDRNTLCQVQTPQGFAVQALYDAYQAHGCEYSDDAGVMEAASIPVCTAEGNRNNIKLTTKDDMVMAEAITQKQKVTVTGFGYDVHAFASRAKEVQHVTLCGISIEHPYRLIGHSDADVALHALTDALLGSIAAGDIGEHFPPSDVRFAGADSSLFVKHALDLIAQKHGQLEHIDLTIIAESPKISPHKDAMRKHVAELCALDIECVSIKATTTEQLGFTGRKEGIAAHAVVTVTR